MNLRSMPRWIRCFWVLVFVSLVGPTGFAEQVKLPFYVYEDAQSKKNHFTPSGWMGDWGDLELKDVEENPHSGSSSIKIIYSGERTQGANWVGIYWQDPPNNWGSKPGGFDLTGARKLTFWARGEKGAEKIDEMRVGGIPGEYFDSDVAYIGPIELKLEWTQYEIDLSGKDLVSIKGGFMWSAKAEDNPEGFVIYFDDIRYE